jgi:hypothetical protein
MVKHKNVQALTLIYTPTIGRPSFHCPRNCQQVKTELPAVPDVYDNLFTLWFPAIVGQFSSTA